jgi:hypothetical protein
MTAQFSSRTLQRLLSAVCSIVCLPCLSVNFHRPPRPRRRKISSALNLCISVAAVVVSGCASAPVQEMSNARQTVRAAQDADAAKYAPESLLKAQTLLSQAEAALHRHEYRSARRHAMEAHENAAEALHAAEAHR